MRKSYCYLFVAAFIACLFKAQKADAYTVVQISTNAPASLESEFLANTTTQFNAVVVPNPFYPNTYNVLLSSAIPVTGYPPSYEALLNYIATVDSYTYVYGWADGERYDRSQVLDQTVGLFNQCASTNTFLVAGSSSVYDTHISSQTCKEVLVTLESEIYQMNFSTPTIVPGTWQ